MKVTLKYDQLSYHGKLNDLIYYWHPQAGKMVARRRPQKHKESAGNARFRLISRNLRDIQPSEGFAEDLRVYLQMLKNENPVLGIMNWYALYNQMMWKMQDLMPGVDLTILTREEIIQDDLPCRSVYRAVTAGLVPKARGFERFTEHI
ncbi:MAG TPA: hypothetical protein PL124_00460 [Candidatus Cloacimonadota bacterium]|nr:hypothetical protein [Candidatus Cloacimonadota bacterium]HPS37863.1 hypothetical protein [Candidatus Cloacimonadota bacterium]